MLLSTVLMPLVILGMVVVSLTAKVMPLLSSAWVAATDAYVEVTPLAAATGDDKKPLLSTAVALITIGKDSANALARNTPPHRVEYRVTSKIPHGLHHGYDYRRFCAAAQAALWHFTEY